MESVFQSKVKHKLKETFEGCTVMKLDANYLQGIPDYLVLFEDKYALLEIKDSEKAKHRPNQDFYVNKFNTCAFASFLYPENIDEVFERLEQYFRS